MLDLLIRGAAVFDGSGRPGSVRDVGVRAAVALGVGGYARLEAGPGEVLRRYEC
jgi:N-acyl-D-aspartate/D-glutamate deacylase